MNANAANDFGLQTVLVDLVHDVFAHAGKIIPLEIRNGQEENALQLAQRLRSEQGGRGRVGRGVDGRDRGRRETHRGDIGREKRFVLVDDVHPHLRVVLVLRFIDGRTRRQGKRRSLGSLQWRPGESGESGEFCFGALSNRKASNLPLVDIRIIAPHRIDMEKLVQLARGVAHDPGLDGFRQQLAIPSNQMVRVGRSLIAGVMRENVVITARRRACPDVCAAIPVRFRIGQIAVEKRMVQGSAEIAGREEVDAVQIGNVHAATIGRDGVLVEFVDIQHEQQNVHAVAVLEERDAFAPVGQRELVGVVGGEERRDRSLHRHGGRDVAHDSHDQALFDSRLLGFGRAKSLRQLLHHFIHTLTHSLR